MLLYFCAFTFSLWFSLMMALCRMSGKRGFIIIMATAQFASSHFICIRIHQKFLLLLYTTPRMREGQCQSRLQHVVCFGTKYRTVTTIILTAYSLLHISDARVMGASHAITEVGKFVDSVVDRPECNGSTFK